jgi:hypothetical protein
MSLALPNWGSVPDWVEAVGTTLAFALAFGFGIHEMRIRRVEVRDNAIRQARLVVVHEPFFGSTMDDHTTIFTRIKNFSDQPIHDVYAGIRYWYDGEDRPVGLTEFRLIDFLGPDEDWEIEFSAPRKEGLHCEKAECWFLDAAGRRWRRAQSKFDPRRLVYYAGPPDFAQQFRDDLPARARAEIDGTPINARFYLFLLLERIRGLFTKR